MFYMNQIKHCKLRAMLYLNYVKPNTTSVLQHNANITIDFLSRNTQNN